MNRYVFIGVVLGMVLGFSYFLRRAPSPTPTITEEVFLDPAVTEGETVEMQGPDYAIFNGGQVKMAEVLPLLPQDRKLEPDELYELKLNLTKQKVKRRLLEIEAGQKGVTPEELLAKQSASWFWSKITDEAIAKYLENQGVDPKTASKETLSNAKKILENSRVMLKGERYLDELYEKANVRYLIEP